MRNLLGRYLDDSEPHGIVKIDILLFFLNKVAGHHNKNN